MAVSNDDTDLFGSPQKKGPRVQCGGCGDSWSS